MAPVPSMSSDPAALSPEQRARAVAALLATGLVRLGSSLLPLPSAPPSISETPSKSDANRLAEARDKSVTVSAG
jgi:hypothetical protein